MNRILILALLSALSCSCHIISPQPRGGKEFHELKEMSTSDIDSIRRKFESYPVNTQIDIYLYGLKYVEPDDNSSLKFLIEGGEMKVPYIIKRIESTDFEFDQAYLTEALASINNDCRCITFDQVESLSEIERGMKNPSHRSRFGRAIQRIAETNANTRDQLSP